MYVRDNTLQNSDSDGDSDDELSNEIQHKDNLVRTTNTATLAIPISPSAVSQLTMSNVPAGDISLQYVPRSDDPNELFENMVTGQQTDVEYEETLSNSQLDVETNQRK